MSVKATCLYGTTTVPAGPGTIVGPVTVVTIIDKITSYGQAAGDLTLSIVESGDTAGVDDTLEKKSHLLGESYTWPGLVGQVLNVGDFISAAATGSINLRISGRQVS